MTEAIRGDVLGRKAQAARRAFEARAMSPAKALRRALSRTADVLWDLALVTQGVSQELLDQDGVIDSLPQGDLLMVLDGPEGALGLATIDREIMTGLIEVQTIQQVTQIPVDDRPLTRTDAAMMAPLLDGTLDRLARNLVDHPLRPQLAGYRFGSMVEDARAAGLLLEASSYRLFRVAIDLALGRRRGELQLIFPEREIRDAAAAMQAPGPHAQMMKLLPAHLNAVLARVTIPLGMARALKPGQLIPLPLDVLDGVELTAGQGKTVAKGRMGQLDGMRAVRLTWPEMPGAAAAAAGMAAMTGGAAAALAEPGLDMDFSQDDAAGSGNGAVDGFGGDLPELPAFDADEAGEGGIGDFDFSGGEEALGEEAESLDDFDFGSFGGEMSLDLDENG